MMWIKFGCKDCGNEWFPDSVYEQSPNAFAPREVVCPFCQSTRAGYKTAKGDIWAK